MRLDGDTVQNVLLHTFLHGLTVLMAVPYLYALSRSFQPTELLRNPRPYRIPPFTGEPITLEHYQHLLNSMLVVEWTISTFIIATGATLPIVVIDSMIAFSLMRLDWPDQGLIMGVILASFIIPYYMNITPLYQTASGLGLINTYWGVVLPAVTSSLSVFLPYQFFKDTPAEHEEVARLGRSTTFQVHTRIILPLVEPILSALVLFTLVHNWNVLPWPLLVLSDEMAYALPIGLVNLYRENIGTPGLHTTITILGSLLLFIIHLIFQGQIVRAVQMRDATG